MESSRFSYYHVAEKAYDHPFMSFPPRIKCGINCSGNPVIPIWSGLPPESIPAKAGAGVTAC